MYTYFLDIETSKIICDDKSKMQVTYLSNIVKMNYITKEIVSSIFFRTIEETINYIHELETCTIWSHNLDYELTFVLRELGEVNGVLKYDKTGQAMEGIYEEYVQNIVLRDKHSPLTITLDCLPQITFRDSYALFNKSVAQLGKDLVKRGQNLTKLDYDYQVTRLPWDKLEQHDYDYNERDNLVVAYSLINYMNDNDYSFDEIPLTFTSAIKRQRKDYIIKNFGKKAINKFFFDRNAEYQDFDFFELKLKVYQGGMTASNILQTAKVITSGVYSVDKKSDYPHQMASRYFPYYTKESTSHYFGEIADSCFKLGNYKGFMGTFKFTNIRVKNQNYLLPISSSQLSKGKCSSDRVQFNGKLISASEIIIPCNDMDIETINLVYKYDKIECTDIFTTTKQRRLRQEEISFLLHCFNIKENVNDKNSIEYNLSKNAINGMYGIKVTAPIRSSHSITEGEIEEIDYFKYDKEERMNFYETFISEMKLFGGSMDIFSDGCYITSYARYELMEIMVELVDLGCFVIYSDTDSVKFYLGTATEGQVMKYLTKKNKEIVEDNISNPRFTNFKETEKLSEEEYSVICQLGIWELETVDENNNPSPIPLFITYGAKKYGYITPEGEVVTTVAGCNKYKPAIAINALAKKENIPIEEAFKLVFAIGTQFDKTASGRTTAYTEKRDRQSMELLTYQGKQINQYGGIIIEDTTYTLNITINDSELLKITRPSEPLFSISIEGVINYDVNRK